MKHLILLCILVKYVVFRFLFESAPKHLQVRMASVCVSSSTCAEAHGWANPSIFTFGKFVSQMARYLSQLLRRVFAFHQWPLHTRAHPWDFALFAFTTFTERDQKNVGVFLENVQRFSFFLRRFLKNVGRFMSFFPRFWKLAAVCWQPGCPECHFFLFFLSKKCLFSALVCEGCESKKTQIPGNAPACHVRARKSDFFEGKIIPSSNVLHWGKRVADFSSLSRIL